MQDIYNYMQDIYKIIIYLDLYDVLIQNLVLLT